MRNKLLLFIMVISLVFTAVPTAFVAETESICEAYSFEYEGTDSEGNSFYTFTVNNPTMLSVPAYTEKNDSIAYSTEYTVSEAEQVGIINDIRMVIKDGGQTVLLSKYNISVSKNSSDQLVFSDNTYYNIIKYAIYGAPDIFFCNIIDGSKFSIKYSSSGIIQALIFYDADFTSYHYTQTEIQEKKKEFYAACNEIKAKIDALLIPSTDKVSLVLAIHDILVLHGSYSTNSPFTHEDYTAYGYIVGKSSVCQGYTLAIRYFLELYGIECTDVSSSAENHIWNAVKLGGSWYHIDLTWDDPTGAYPGTVYHNNFLKTTSEILENHIKSSDMADNWGLVNPVFSATSYPNSIWDGVATQMVNKNGMWYYISGGALVRSSITGLGLDTIVSKAFNLTSDGDYLYYSTGSLYTNFGTDIYRIPYSGTGAVKILTAADNGYLLDIYQENGTLTYIYKAGQYSALTLTYDLPRFDVNGDGVVNLLDILILFSDSSYLSKGDFDFSGTVDNSDVAVLYSEILS